MPRSLRLERENAVYHIINRGNYRQDLFINDGAHLAFEACLFEACEKCGWVLEGFCVMTNHFHLVIRTPKGNLVYGMKWLQSTFANRYHRFRKTHGKLFQGRYKSLIVEEDGYLGALLHYVHLNPVRAGMVSIEQLKDYRWSSFWYLHHKAKRPAMMDCTGALEAAGGLKDSPAGRKQYLGYLKWLTTSDTAQREMAFEKMCRGWALGSKDFKKALLEETFGENESAVGHFEGADLKEANELLWSRLLNIGLRHFHKGKADIQSDLKSASWKVAIAAMLKKQTSAPNTWIANQLNMGVPQSVSRHTSSLLRLPKKKRAHYEDLITRITE